MAKKRTQAFLFPAYANLLCPKVLEPVGSSGFRNYCRPRAGLSWALVVYGTVFGSARPSEHVLAGWCAQAGLADRNRGGSRMIGGDYSY